MNESCYFASSENSGMAEGGANGQLPIWFGDLTIVTFINLDITSEATPETTGFFEVTIDGKLVHSKKDGDGFPNTKEKIDKIAKAIEATK
ncbi:unnamed protein product [Rotaria magnacalcarata]